MAAGELYLSSTTNDNRLFFRNSSDSLSTITGYSGTRTLYFTDPSPSTPPSGATDGQIVVGWFGRRTAFSSTKFHFAYYKGGTWFYLGGRYGTTSTLYTPTGGIRAFSDLYPQIELNTGSFTTWITMQYTS